MTDDDQLAADYEAIRQAALRALGEDLVQAQHHALVGLTDRRDALERQIDLAEQMVFGYLGRGGELGFAGPQKPKPE